MKYDISLKIACMYCLLYRRIIFRTFYIFPITEMRQKNRPNLIWVFYRQKNIGTLFIKILQTRMFCCTICFFFISVAFFLRKTIQIHNQ